MDYNEAITWLRSDRSMTNIIPQEPFETWQVRTAQADAAMIQQAYWIAKAHKESILDTPELAALREENEALREALEKIRQCLRDTIPGNDEEGKMDFFILSPTMKPIAEIATEALAGKEG